MYFDFPLARFREVLNRKKTILLETSKYDNENHHSYLFSNPIETHCIYSPDELPGLVEVIDRHRRQNCYVAGYFGYECGYHFEAVAPYPRSDKPLAFFGAYPQPLVFDHLNGTFDETRWGPPPPRGDMPTTPEPFQIEHPTLDIDEPAYLQVIAKIKNYINEGETYQINFTTRYRFGFRGSALAFYEGLKRKQHVPYSAYLHLDHGTILCYSPELFFRVKDGIITTQPMKGTAKRGKTLAEDKVIEHWLRTDGKNRAENIMIVDLLRNDIGKVCKTASVAAGRLFDVERFETLHQMTSTVTGTLREGVSTYEILKALFPCGSVTGAPKIRSMQIIHELESTSRGVYTGAIGFFAPTNEAIFNVAIRTISLDADEGIMGVGGGIVADSNAAEELAECRLKGAFLLKHDEEFELLETLLWENGYPFLDRHLSRLEESAEYFGFQYDRAIIRNGLLELGRSCVPGRKYRVRLTLGRSGKSAINAEQIGDDNRREAHTITISKTRVNSNNVFLYHKTTHRRIYDTLHTHARREGHYDVLFLNENGEVTEGAISNVFIRRGNSLLTPPVRCGLLNGIYRQYLLETASHISEDVLTENDLSEADAILVCNSVRGIREVRLR